MKSIASMMLVWICFGQQVLLAADYQSLKKEAEQAYSEHSYKQAHDFYAKVATAELTPDEKRWVLFRIADTQLRSEASSQQSDDSASQKAQAELQKFLREDAARDQIWAEANESLADYYWYYPRRHDWGQGWAFYEKALEYWAGSTNLNAAGERYLQLVRKMGSPSASDRDYYYGYFGNLLSVQVLENALKIATNEEDKAHFHFLLAMTLRSQGGPWEQRFRIPREFEQAIKLKKDTKWYDDALYFYAEWMNSNGRAVQDDNGNWTSEPNYEKALELFRRLTSEFRKGETRWYDQAQAQIREITRSTVGVSVPNVFLPDSEIEFYLSWRNVETIEFSLYKVDLNTALGFRNPNSQPQEWLSLTDIANAENVKSWSKQVKVKGPHAPGSETVRLDAKLPKGAYVLEAKAGGEKAREIILVTDIAIVTQTIAGETLVYVCDSGAGAPVSGAEIKFHEHYYDGRNWQWRENAKKADENGIALFESRDAQRNQQFFISARSADRQAFTVGYGNWNPETREKWTIYAFTDRPAYRPGETAHWKITARQSRGSGYVVPAKQKIVLRITDPKGAEIKKAALELNSFGSAWGEVTLGTEMPLGEYQATFLNESEKEQIGGATLFRLEEYKLPEFKVAIRTPEENGRKKTYLLGEKVEVEIQADYYFGGPVANATVEAVVHQSNFYHIYEPQHEYEWFYGDARQGRSFRGYDPGQIIQRQTLKTDAEGKATLTIQTPFGNGNDLEYRIEARVTDSSRREITGSDRVRVSMQRFYVNAKPAHNIYKPQDKVEVQFTALDINDKPIVAEGNVKVTRDYWYEIWINPAGKEIKGDELKKLQGARIFPPLPGPGEKGWRLKFRGYQHDDILTRTLKTDTNGSAMLTFTPEREGYYRISWLTNENLEEGKIPSRPIRGETAVWVGTASSTDLGYRPGGLEILVDKDSFKVGQKAPVMIHVPANDRYVLFTVSAGDLLDYQLIHPEGTVKLLELPIDEKHVPNVFLQAAMVSDQQMFVDSKEVVVPPIKNFLTMEMKPDREQYQPGEEGKFQIVTRNDEGKPVSAEVALSVVDESVFYIQSDYAIDPRQFFFGTKRQQQLQISSSFQQKQYRKMMERDDTLGFNESEERQAGRYDYFYKKKDARGLSLDLTVEKAAPVRARAELATLAAAPAAAEGKVALMDRAANKQMAAPPEEPAVQVRSDFRTSILWQPDFKTDQSGKADVRLKYPDSLTGWKATARAATAENQFGIAQASTRTKQPLIVQLQAPRFFLVGDTVTISGVINNNTDQEQTVAAEMVVEGGEPSENPKRSGIAVKANSDMRVDWILHPRKPGELKIKVIAKGTRYSDAMEKVFPVYEHGLEKFLAVSGKSRGNEVITKLDLPSARKSGTTSFSVQVTPSLAVTMLDALPYLIDYPYGCTEQTMSRFLPTVITAKTLKDLGLNPEDVMGRTFGGIETQTANKTHPGGKKNLEKMDEMTQKGLQRLYDFQHSDGGWGWWREGDSDPFMSAYIVWGLTLAHQAGVDLKAGVLDRAANYLDKKLVDAETDYPLQAWLLHALAAKYSAEKQNRLSEFQDKAFANLWSNRERINAYGRALFALSASYFGKKNEAETLIRNLENGVKLDTNTGSSVLNKSGNQNSSMTMAHWGEDGIHWRWSEGGVESTAFALRALMQIDPENKLVEPVANWLIKNRRGAQWSNTRDTAIVVLAMNDYLRKSGEIKGSLEFELLVNGKSIAQKKIAGADVFNAPSRFEIPAASIRDGENEIRIVRKSGEAPIYFAAQSTFFSIEEPVTPAGNEIFLKREYYRLAAIPTLLKGYTYEKQLLKDNDVVRSGDRIETVITVEAKNNYEYLLFEDLKPAGFEAVQIRSGENLYAHQLRSSSVESESSSSPAAVGEEQREEKSRTGNTRWVYQELRDRKVALFVDKLAEGFWEIRYEMRAETPGDFHALPVVGHAMYVPEIRANGSEMHVRVQDSF